MTKVAQVLGVCRATAYRLVESGELPHVRVANAIRVDPRDVERWLWDKKTKGA
jgi:excisionase family DNA binding protein